MGVLQQIGALLVNQAVGMHWLVNSFWRGLSGAGATCGGDCQRCGAKARDHTESAAFGIASSRTYFASRSASSTDASCARASGGIELTGLRHGPAGNPIISIATFITDGNVCSVKAWRNGFTSS